MRRFILIAAMLLISASARAEGPRGLSLASNDETVAAGQLQATETQAQSPTAEAPKAAAQPVDAAAQPPKADQAKSDQIKSDQTRPASRKSERQKFTRSPLEARVVDELHRNGIYW